MEIDMTPEKALILADEFDALAACLQARAKALRFLFKPKTPERPIPVATFGNHVTFDARTKRWL